MQENVRLKSALPFRHSSPPWDPFVAGGGTEMEESVTSIEAWVHSWLFWWYSAQNHPSGDCWPGSGLDTETWSLATWSWVPSQSP